MKRNEPIPYFKPWDITTYRGDTCVILTVSTYCLCCDRFLDEVIYSIKTNSGEILHKVRERDLIVNLEGEY